MHSKQTTALLGNPEIPESVLNGMPEGMIHLPLLGSVIPCFLAYLPHHLVKFSVELLCPDFRSGNRGARPSALRPFTYPIKTSLINSGWSGTMRSAMAVLVPAKIRSKKMIPRSSFTSSVMSLPSSCNRAPENKASRRKHLAAPTLPAFGHSPVVKTGNLKITMDKNALKCCHWILLKNLKSLNPQQQEHERVQEALGLMCHRPSLQHQEGTAPELEAAKQGRCRRVS